jgi:hypothetical protein
VRLSSKNWVAGEEPRTLEDPDGIVAAGDRVQDRAVERDAVDVGDRRAHLASDRGDTGLVTEAHGLVVLVGVHGILQVAREAGPGQRRGDRLVQLGRAEVSPVVEDELAEGGVEVSKDLSSEPRHCGGGDAGRTAGGLHDAAVRRGDVRTVLVEQVQTHDVVAHAQRPPQLDLPEPA